MPRLLALRDIRGYAAMRLGLGGTFVCKARERAAHGNRTMPHHGPDAARRVIRKNVRHPHHSAPSGFPRIHLDGAVVVDKPG